MSLPPFFDHPRARTDTPVRVFPAIAPTPALPAPRWWNNPLVLLPATVILTVHLSQIPALPAYTALVVLALSLPLSTLGTLSYFAWDDSHDTARTEATWVATQSGHHIHTQQDHLLWTTPDGTPHPATLTPGPHGWDLTLTQQHWTPQRRPWQR